MNTKAHWSRIRFGFVPLFFVELWKNAVHGQRPVPAALL